MSESISLTISESAFMVESLAAGKNSQFQVTISIPCSVLNEGTCQSSKLLSI